MIMLNNYPTNLYVFSKKNAHNEVLTYVFNANGLELVSKELNHLAAILHVYAGGSNFMK